VTTEAQALLARARERAAQANLPYFGAVTPAEAAALLRASPEARLIDVRTEAEWDYVGHIPDTTHIEWNTYPSGERNPRFLQELTQAVTDQEAPVLFLCRSGQRSDAAARAAQRAGFKHAMNILEGFEGQKDAEGHRNTVGGWRKAGLPWEQG